MDKIKTSILSVFLTSILFLGGVNILSDDTYFCEDRNIVMQCDKLTAYYGLDSGKCWNAEIGNKLCRSGWMEIENDFEQEQIITEKNIGVKYSCDNQGCSIIE